MDDAGWMILLPYAQVPPGYAHCDGRLLSISESQGLFMLIGADFGGDGINTFALPDYRDQAPGGSYYCVALG